MDTDSKDVKILWTALREAPNDDTLKLVLADCLEENGDLRIGCALRWCVARGVWPRITKQMACWYTDSSFKHPGKKAEVERAILPVFFFVVGRECEHLKQLEQIPIGISFGTLAEAIDFLGYVLEQLRYWSTESSD